MFAKFYEIPSLPFKDIEKPKCRERMDRITDGWTDVKTVYPPSPAPSPHAQFAGGIMKKIMNTFLLSEIVF